MYVCGITPYSYSHIGHGRCYVVFDLLYRVLNYLTYEVTYCRNFTDVDDKLLDKAERQFGDRLRYKEIADIFIASYHRDMAALGCLPPTHEPRVTEEINGIIAFVQGLINNGYAYQTNGDVYFRIVRFADYGKLSKHKLEDLRAGERVDVRQEKEDPLDFALWKAEPEGMFWQSPWGYGRPGWHIECSSMARSYLGEQIDLHGGGADLIFPHHENEIAQSQALSGKPFATYWIHNGFVNINKEKMSKSLDNVLNLQEILKQVDPMVLRFYLLSVHYRAPLDFSFDDVDSLRKSYQRLCKAFAQQNCNKTPVPQPGDSPIVDRMIEMLCDDLNTSGMFGVLFQNLSALQQDAKQLCLVKRFIQEVLGLTLEPLQEEQVEITPAIQKLIDERVAARAQKDWTRADVLRDQLHALGVPVQDEKI